MRRLLLVLPLCLVLAPDSPGLRLESGSMASSPLCHEGTPAVSCLLAPHPEAGILSSAVWGWAGPRCTVADGSFALWVAGDPTCALPDAAEMDRLARTDPIRFLTNCLRRYDREVADYRLTMLKHERIGGVLHKPERVEVSFRAHPFSVLMVWKEGARRAQKSLYVAGENNHQLAVRPTGLGAWLVVLRDPHGAEVRDSSRYPPTEFGLRTGTVKALQAWRAAQARGDLKIAFLSEERLPQVGDRLCWVLERTGYTRKEEDGITRSRFYIDKQNWLQVGSVLWGKEDELLGEYFFRDIDLHPDFPPGTFQRDKL